MKEPQISDYSLSYSGKENAKVLLIHPIAPCNKCTQIYFYGMPYSQCYTLPVKFAVDFIGFLPQREISLTLASTNIRCYDISLYGSLR
jgi:hypothetical protein